MSFGEFSVGSVLIKPNLILAPMSGVTNSAFRRLIKGENTGAVGLVVTEFVSVEGLTRGNRQSIAMTRFRPEERPISVQIYGYGISRMVDAAIMMEQIGVDILDINCACPMPKVVRRGAGCQLMREPDHLGKVLSEVKRAVSIPMTVKIRAGWDHGSKNAVEISRVAEQSGALMIAVHGRVKTDLYSGKSDWGIISDVARAVSIPVVGSGDVYDFGSAKSCFASGVAGIMVARGAVSNPWVFSDIKRSYEGSVPEDLSGAKIVAVLERYMELLSEDLPKKAVLGRMKYFSSRLISGIRGASMVRKALCRSQSLDAFCELLPQVEAFIEGSAGALQLSHMEEDD